MRQQVKGQLALVIDTGGRGRTERLPASHMQAAERVSELIGGPLEAIGGTRWCAYVDEEGVRHGALPNLAAEWLARAMGWPGNRDGVPLCGPVVFLGRDGTDETDVPEPVLLLARNAGMV